MGRYIVAAFVLVAVSVVAANPLAPEDAASLKARSFSLRNMAPIEFEDYILVCNQEPLDLIFVIDGSASIWKVNFTKGLAFIEDFLDMYEISPSLVRVAAVTYGLGWYENGTFPFGEYNEREELLDAVRHTHYPAGRWTGTDVALHHMIQEILPGAREGVRTLCIVLTDGNSQMRWYTAGNATIARRMGVKMFAVGVGKGVRNSELLAIAGSKKRTFRAPTYGSLIDAVKMDLAYQTCVKKPKPTTTPAPLPCGVEFPADVELVYDAATLGPDGTHFVAEFFSYTFERDGMEQGMQVGSCNGLCPKDAGFEMGMYNNVSEVRVHLEGLHNDQRLGDIIQQGLAQGLTGDGARSHVKKVAVVFIGAHTDFDYLQRQIDLANERVDGGIQIFFSDVWGSTWEVDELADMYGTPPLVGSIAEQSELFHSALCHTET